MTTMPDLSNLKLVEENIEVADDASYQDAQEFPPPLPEAVYTFIQGKPKFTATDAGFLSAEMEHTVSGGEFDGKRFPFDRVSNKPFERSGVKVSIMKDQLRAIGDRNTYRSHAEYAQALEAGEGKPFKAQVQWEAGCAHKDTPQETDWNDKRDPKEGGVFRVKGMRNFPVNGGGRPSESVKCPVCGQDAVARARINRRIAQ